MIAARREWDAKTRAIHPQRLVFIDESGFRTDLTRTHGRSLRGDRVPDAVPHAEWETVTLIGAVTLEGPIAPFAFEGACDAAAFATYVEKVLLPELWPDDVVVMDNLSVHKTAGVRALFEASGHEVLYLPPYSPDLNPIEPMFSKAKGVMRSIAARTVETIYEGLGVALRAITRDDCHGWFRLANYG